MDSLHGFVDLSSRTKLQLTGGDRKRYLNGQVTNDVNKASPEKAIYACVTNAKGKLESDVFVTEPPGGESFLIDGPPDLVEDLFMRLDRYIIADDAELTEVTDDWQLFHTLGSDSVSGPSSNRFGQPGIDVWLPKGETLDGSGEALTSEQLEELRIAHGIGKWGTELTPDILPQEANLQDRAIDFHKGCYIGQEVISRIKSVGRVNKQLVALVSREENQELAPGMELLAEGKSVGTLTSCQKSEKLGQWIALAYVKRGHLEPGTELNARSGENILSSLLEIRETPLI